MIDGQTAADWPHAPPGWRWRTVCLSADLLEGGDGVRFELARPWGVEPAFVIRYDGLARAFRNRCSHVPVELDWMPGRFFDESGLYLVCATHGAMYEAGTGQCAGGPCSGRGLPVMECLERDGQVQVLVQEQEK